MLDKLLSKFKYLSNQIMCLQYRFRRLIDGVCAPVSRVGLLVLDGPVLPPFPFYSLKWDAKPESFIVTTGVKMYIELWENQLCHSLRSSRIEV